MQKFLIKEIKNANLSKELEDIGFDKSYIHKAKEKFQYKTLKIYNLTLPQANILKQIAVSIGADCAVHREIITAKVQQSDCILGGSYAQLQKIAEKLKLQPFSLKNLAEFIEEDLNRHLQPIKIKNKLFDFAKPYLVGILNLTQNSFSDGGDFFDIKNAQKRFKELIEEGADIIEFGAESTKPFAKEVSPEKQLEKLIPMLEFAKNFDIPISVDTRNSKVVKKVLDLGADLINDVSGLDFDSKLVDFVAAKNVPLIIQHSEGLPENMQNNPSYTNLMDEIFIKLREKIDFAQKNGIEHIIIDAGIGFGKTKEHNLEILKRIEELVSLNCPIMLGVSRKSFLNLQDQPNEIKDIYTLAVNSTLLDKKVNFLRVHNVKLHKFLLDNFY